MYILVEYIFVEAICAKEGKYETIVRLEERMSK